MENFGFDLDGVLHNFTGPAYDYAVKNYGVTQDFYTFWRDADRLLSKEIWTEFLAVPALYRSKALQEDVDTVRKLDKKYEIFYVTVRPQAVAEVTYHWLWESGFPYVDHHLYICDKSKREVLEKIPMKYYVEDRLHIVDQIKDLTTVIIKRTPWNRSARGYKEISRIPELLEII